MDTDTSRESTVQFCRMLFSRLDYPGRDAIVVAGSRIHEDDLIGQLRNPPREEQPRQQEEQRSVATEPVLAPLDDPYYVAGAPLPLPCNRPWWMP